MAPSSPPDGLIEAQGIDDAIAQEAIHLETLIVGGEHLEIGAFGKEDAIVEIDDVLDERQLEVQAGLGDEAAPRDGLAEAQHDGLLCLSDGEDGAQRDHEKNDRRESQGQRELHWRGPPCWNGARAGSGTKGMTPAPEPCSSSTTLSAPPSTRSIVSR